MYPGSTFCRPCRPATGDGHGEAAAKGIQSYGIGPASTESDTINYGAHSDVERLAESSLYRLVEFTWRATLEVAASQ